MADLDGFRGVRSGRRGEGGVDRNGGGGGDDVRAFYFCTERYIRKMAERYIRKFYVIKYYILRISFASLVLF